MPFNHITYIRDEAFAENLLTSFRGTLIHELGHYTGANSNNIAGGHLIIEDIRNRGAFVVHNSYRLQLEADENRHKLAFAGACVLELYACGLTNVNRCKIDVDNYLGRYENVSDIDDTIRIGVMNKWKDDYTIFFRSHRLSIRGNYELCLRLVTERDYLIDGFHVIPTSRLTPPHQRNEADRVREEELVNTEAARLIALKQFIGDDNAGTSNLVGAGDVKTADPGKTSLVSRFLKRLR
jgi:hypothetical protein